MSYFPIPEELSPAAVNPSPGYLPVRNSNNYFDWEIVAGWLVGHFLNKKLNVDLISNYNESCKVEFKKVLDDHSFWPVLEKAYLFNDCLHDISPLFLLLTASVNADGQVDGNSVNHRLYKFFKNFIGNFTCSLPKNTSSTFVEGIFLTLLEDGLEECDRKSEGEYPYLPFLRDMFRKDVAFLFEHPDYLNQVFHKVLKLYAFAYCSQLALNISNWKNEPTPKPLFFIFDTEKSSAERTSIKKFGYKHLSLMSNELFPMLSLLEDFQQEGKDRRPLWKLYSDIKAHSDSQSVIGVLNKYIFEFCQKRGVDERAPVDNIEDAFSTIRKISLEQFTKKNSTRIKVYTNYAAAFRDDIYSDFVQKRGAAGRTLVLNQDLVLLLTNLVIGNNEKLRLHELLEGFKQRGFYFDNQTIELIVAFYERMGNVERMSDSGDAVYVRKTL